jgi:hypothetical protein
MPALHLLFGRMPELHSPASHTQSSAPHVRRSPSTDQSARLAARPARTPRQAALPRHDTAPLEGVGLLLEAEDAWAHAEDARERLPSAAMAEASCPSRIELPLFLPCFKEDAKFFRTKTRTQGFFETLLRLAEGLNC